MARTLNIEDGPVLGADVVGQGDGRHLIHEYAGGVTLFALVESAEVTGFEVEGGGPGVKVSSITEQAIPTISRVEPEKSSWPCWLCVCKNHNCQCVPILCDKPIVYV